MKFVVSRILVSISLSFALRTILLARLVISDILVSIFVAIVLAIMAKAAWVTRYQGVFFFNFRSFCIESISSHLIINTRYLLFNLCNFCDVSVFFQRPVVLGTFLPKSSVFFSRFCWSKSYCYIVFYWQTLLFYCVSCFSVWLSINSIYFGNYCFFWQHCYPPHWLIFTSVELVCIYVIYFSFQANQISLWCQCSRISTCCSSLRDRFNPTLTFPPEHPYESRKY